MSRSPQPTDGGGMWAKFGRLLSWLICRQQEVSRSDPADSPQLQEALRRLLQPTGDEAGSRRAKVTRTDPTDSQLDQGDIQRLQEEIQRLQEDIQRLKEGFQGLHEVNQCLQEEIQHLQEEIQRLQEEIQRLKENTQRLKEVNQWLQEDIQRLKENIQRLQEVNQWLQKEIQRIPGEIQRLQKEIQRLQEDIQRLQEVNQWLQEDNQRLQENIQRLQEVNQLNQEEIQQLQEEIQRLKEAIQRIKEAVQRIKEVNRWFQEAARAHIQPTDDEAGSSSLNISRPDPTDSQLEDVPGDRLDLLLRHIYMLKVVRGPDRKIYNTRQAEWEWRSSFPEFISSPIIQPSSLSADDCRRCSPFDHLKVINVNISGSQAEALNLPALPGERKDRSDTDLMIELGPVAWIYPVESTGAGVGQESATAADPTSQASDEVQRLVMADTDNPGFFLVLDIPLLLLLLIIALVLLLLMAYSPRRSS